MQEEAIAKPKLQRKSLIIATGCPASKWHQVISCLEHLKEPDVVNSFHKWHDENSAEKGTPAPPFDFFKLIAKQNEEKDHSRATQPTLVYDSRAVWQLDFWQQNIPQPFFLLFYVGAETLIAHSLADGKSAEASLQLWLSAHERMLNFLRHHRKQALLVKAEAVVAQPERFIDILQKNEIPTNGFDEIKVSTFPPPEDELSLARYFIYDDSHVHLLEAELEARAQPLRESVLPQETNDLKSSLIQRWQNVHQLQNEKTKLQELVDQLKRQLNDSASTVRSLQDQIDQLHNEQRNQEDLKNQIETAGIKYTDLEKAHQEIKEENELLLLQLHQVQEELEEIFLKKQRLEQERQEQGHVRDVKQDHLSPTVSENTRNKQNTKSPVKKLSRLIASMSKTQRNLRKDIALLRESEAFEEEWYLKEYPDVALAGMDPVRHYLLYGANEGRNPSPSFNTLHYLATHSGVIMPKMNPLVHYLKHKKPKT